MTEYEKQVLRMLGRIADALEVLAEPAIKAKAAEREDRFAKQRALAEEWHALGLRRAVGSLAWNGIDPNAARTMDDASLLTLRNVGHATLREIRRALGQAT